MSELTPPGPLSQSLSESLSQQHRVGQGGQVVPVVHRRKRRRRSKGAQKAPPWLRTIGGSRVLWLAIVAIAVLLLVVLAGPVINVNHLSVTF